MKGFEEVAVDFRADSAWSFFEMSRNFDIRSFFGHFFDNFHEKVVVFEFVR